jgi:hypothetical protein
MVKKPEKIVVDPALTDEEIEAKEGTYFDANGYKIIDYDADVYARTANGEEKLLAKFRRQVFPEELVQLAWNSFYKAAAASRSRGPAAGPINLKSPYWKKRKPVKINGFSTQYLVNGKLSKMRVNNLVYSSVLGYYERTPFMKVPCRLTSYTQIYFKGYKQGLPFIQAIDKKFKDLVPDAYAKQLSRAKKQPEFRIDDTAFSSVTINRNFRTALHKDAGDYSEGFGNLSVVERGKYHGGETLFPQYKIGFNLRAGDFIAMDVHQWHCNAELYETAEDKLFNRTLAKIYEHDPETGTMGSEYPFSRISFVCYLREKLIDCNANESRAYYKRIMFDPKNGPIGDIKTRLTKRRSNPAHSRFKSNSRTTIKRNK